MSVREKIYTMGEMKTKQNKNNFAMGGYLYTADFDVPEGDKQISPEQAMELCAAINTMTRHQMLTDKEAEQIEEICVNAAVRCGYLVEVTDKQEN